MSIRTKERYARRKRSEANKLSQHRAAAWSDADDDGPLQMSDDQLDRRPSNTDSQVSGPASDASDKPMEEQLTGQPAAPATPAAPAAQAAIPMEAWLVITQALKLSSTSSRFEIRPPTFNGEGDLTLFLK